MLINDAIREASTEHEIFFLLTAYVEAVGYCDKLQLLPGEMRILPLEGASDVEARVHALQQRLQSVASGSDIAARSTMGEALEIFNTALRRLGSLQAEKTTALSFAA